MKKAIFGCIILLSMVFGGCSKEIQKEPTEKNEYGDKLIAETMGVPEHYTFQNESESGISKVLVDADVLVPEVYGVDVLEAIPAVFTDEEVRAFVERHSGDFQWKHALTDQPYAGEGLSKEDLDDVFLGIQDYSLWLYNEGGQQGDDTIQEISAHFWINEKTGELAYQPELSYTKFQGGDDPVDPRMFAILPLNENNMADDCTISLEQAVAFGDEEVKFFFSDFFLSQYGQLGESGNPQVPNYYGFRYTRNINGIPVNVEPYGGGGGDGSDYTIGNENICITVNDDGVCYVYYQNPLKTGEVVEKNVTLLPFEDIIDIFEKVSILSIQHLELYDNLVENVMDIREIRFGYMAVKQSESVGGYYYIPVWDFYGLHYPVYENNQYYPEAYDAPEFTINAIDGTVIDRNHGY